MMADLGAKEPPFLPGCCSRFRAWLHIAISRPSILFSRSAIALFYLVIAVCGIPSNLILYDIISKVTGVRQDQNRDLILVHFV